MGDNNAVEMGQAAHVNIGIQIGAIKPKETSHNCMDYVAIQFSSLLQHIVIMNNVATALIRLICIMQLSFRLDKRPGERHHLVMDGKNSELLRRRIVRAARSYVACGLEYRAPSFVCSPSRDTTQ